MNKMKKVPEIRFKEFAEDWENTDASIIFKTYFDKNHPDLPVLSASQEYGMIIREDVGFKVQHNKENEAGYKRVLPGQFVIHLRSFQGGFAHSDVEGITSPAYTIIEFRDKSQQDDIFWKYVLTSKEFIKRLETVTYGIRDGRSISFEDFSELGFNVPDIKEQRKIGKTLTVIDTLIRKLEQKLEKLRNIKQSLLNQMFVNVNRGGGYAPLIRFEGYGEKWQRFALGDLVSIRAGQSPSFFNKGNVPYVKVDDLNNSYWLQINTNYRVANNDRATLIAKNSIVFPKRGAAILTNKIRVLGENAYIDTNMMALEVSKEISSNFLGFNIENCGLFRIADTSTIPQINNKHIEPYIVYVPKTQEQESIEHTFVLLNGILEKSSFKLTKLRTMKQSLLQKMFV